MESSCPTIHTRLAQRVHRLRSDQALTLDGLARRAGVSRSMISLIERGETSPTAAVLDWLAAGLGVTIASLFAEEARPDASPVARRGDQPTWRDPESGYRRRNLSPPGFPSPIELVEVVLPARSRVAYDTTARAVRISQQVWVLSGEVELTVGDVAHHLRKGDCLAMRLDRPTTFFNPTGQPTRYLVALTSDSIPTGPRSNHRVTAL